MQISGRRVDPEGELGKESRGAGVGIGRLRERSSGRARRRRTGVIDIVECDPSHTPCLWNDAGIVAKQSLHTT